MKKVLTIGGATQDIFLDYRGADSLSITQQGCTSNFMLLGAGEKVEIEALMYHSGGGATNSAASFSRLGYKADCCAILGDDYFGQQVVDELQRYNLDTSLMKRRAGMHTGTSFIINSPQKERTIFAYRGANTTLQKNDIPFDAFNAYDVLYVTSLSNQAAHLLPLIVEQAKKHNLPVATNPGKSQLQFGAGMIKKSLSNIDIFIMNGDEARAFMLTLISHDEDLKRTLACQPNSVCITGDMQSEPYLLDATIMLDDVHFSIKKFFSTVLGMGPRVVVITNDANGVYVATKEACFFQQSLHVNVVDTVGAGDSFGSCFVASLFNDYDLATSLRYGVINSSSVLQQVGAKPGLLTFEQLAERAKTVDQGSLTSFTLDT